MFDVGKHIEQWRASLVGSEMLGNSTVDELESHLREQMGDLKASGLSDEEAFFISRHRLGEAEILAAEFAKVSPHRRLADRLSWMAAGVLGYLLTTPLTVLAMRASTILGYTVGLRGFFLTLLAFAMLVTVFAGVGAIVWWCFASRSPSRTAMGMPSAGRTGLLAACAIVVLYWTENFGRVLLDRTMVIPDRNEIFMPQGAALSLWETLMPFLFVSLIALLSLRNRRRAGAVTN